MLLVRDVMSEKGIWICYDRYDEFDSLNFIIIFLISFLI